MTPEDRLQISVARSFTLTLPLAPSVNALFANRKTPKKELAIAKLKRKQRGRVKTARYMRWITRAGWTLKMQRPPSFSGPVAVTIGVPLKMPGDLDNRCKATLVLLQTMRVIANDRDVHDLRVKRCLPQQTTMVVTVEGRIAA